MLKFLDNRTHQKPAKSPKKYQPQMLYGISAQAPETFQKPHTIIHKQTYVNPYLPFQQNRKKSLPMAKHRFQPQWTKKTNLQLIEQQKIVSSQLQRNDNKSSANSRYKQSYYQQFQKNSSGRFKKTRGQFTNFIQKNNHYKSIGPIHGDERTETRIQDTKKSVWLKPDLTKMSNFSSSKYTKSINSSLCNTKLSKFQKKSTPYSTYFDQMRNSIGSSNQLVQTNTSISKNSKLLSQKSRIRDHRQEINHTFQRDLYDRKKKSPHHKNFQLPKLQSQIYMSNSPNKIMPNGKIMPKSPSQFYKTNSFNNSAHQSNDDGMDNLDQFETKIWKKFK